MRREKILILGATGRTGKLILQLALREGHQVNVLVRDAGKFNLRHENLVVFQGSPMDRNSLEVAMGGCEAVLSALNISRNSDFPWAKLRTPSDFLSGTAANIISICNDLNINRVIVISAWGVGDTRKDIPGWFRWFIEHSNIGIAYQDHYRQEQIFSASALRYTLIRPVAWDLQTSIIQIG